MSQLVRAKIGDEISDDRLQGIAPTARQRLGRAFFQRDRFSVALLQNDAGTCRILVVQEELDLQNRRRRAHPARSLQSKLIQSDGELLPFKDNAFDCVVSIRLFQLIPKEAKTAILKEMWRVSRKWLIVERMYAQSMRDFGRARYLLCKILGRESELPVLDRDIVDAGWKEFKRIPLRGMKNWVGIYRKSDS